MNYDNNNCIFNTNARFIEMTLRMVAKELPLLLDEPPGASACLKL